MLKISTTENADQIVLRIEGKLIAPWTQELESAWRPIVSELSIRRLLLDIRDTTLIDQGGLELLARIAQFANAGFLADTPLTRQFAGSIRELEAAQKRRKQ